MDVKQKNYRRCNSLKKGWDRLSMLLLPLLFIFIFLFSTYIEAEIKIVSIIDITRENILESTRDIKYTRCGNPTPEKRVIRGTVLNTGDELESTSKSIVLLIRCSDNPLSRFTFRGKFHFVVYPPGEKTCVFGLKKGNIDVLTARPTILSSGETILGSEQTQYGVRIVSKKTGPVQEWSVYEGKVNIQSPNFKGELVQGQKLIIKGNKPANLEKIKNKDVKRTAKLYSRISASMAEIIILKRDFQYPIGDSKIPVTSRVKKVKNIARELIPKFKSLYLDIFTKPTNSKLRLKLAVLQVNCNIPLEAIYHSHLAGKHVNNKKQQAMAALIEGIAFYQLSQSGEGDKRFLKAKEMDPSVFDESNLKHYKFLKELRQEIKRIQQTLDKNKK